MPTPLLLPLALLLSVFLCGALLPRGASAGPEDDMMAEMLGGRQFGRGKDKKDPAVKADLPLIRCGACEAAARHMLRATQKLRDNATKANPMREADILDMLEGMCDPDAEGGDWITYIDLQEDGTKLRLVDMPRPRECESECRTIARSCADLLEKADLVELSEALWSGNRRAHVQQVLCYDQTRACAKKTPPMPEDRPVGAPYKALEPEDLNLRDTMRRMRAAGMGGTLYNRDDMLKYAKGAPDDEPPPKSEAGLSSKLRQVLRDMEEKEAAGEGGDNTAQQLVREQLAEVEAKETGQMHGEL